MTWEGIWHFTLMLLDVGGVVMLAALYRQAPDVWQKAVLVWMGTALLILAVARFYALVGIEWWVSTEALGRAVEHIGVLAYAFRLFVVEQERRCLPISSALHKASAP
jgi:integral membrane sensor domain MASE1